MSKYGYSDASALSAAATALREAPILDGILNELAEAAISEWSATSSDGATERETAWHKYQAVQDLRQSINNLILPRD